MDLRRYLRAIRRGWWIVLIVAVLGGAGGYAKAARSPKVYAASVTFYVVTPGINGTTAYGTDQFAQDQANSYAQLLSTQGFARLVLDDTGLSGTSSDLAAEITGSARIDSVLLDARIVSTSLPRLRSIQRGVASQFPVYVKQFATTDTVAVKAVLPTPPVSTVPVSPKTSVDIAVGLAAGLVLGLLIAALREMIDTSIRSGSELEELSEVPLIGSIAFDASTKQAPVVSGSGSSRRAEDFRQLRTNLEFVHSAQQIQALLVTSSIASEGKSSTAINIAVTAAERGDRVLLIDADLRRPQIADYLGFDRSVGLTTVLTGRVELDIAVRTWGEHALAVLPSGACPPNPSELLNSDAMRELVATMRRRYDLIVIDTPPVLTVTDAAVCSGLVDGTVLVYRYGKTRRANLLGALHALRSVEARLVGVVLNMRPRRGVDGERYGTYDSYVTQAPGRSRLRRVLRALGRPFRWRRGRRTAPQTQYPGYVAMVPAVAPVPAAGFEPPTAADADDISAWGESVIPHGFETRRARRPLRSSRVRVDHLDLARRSSGRHRDGLAHQVDPDVAEADVIDDDLLDDLFASDHDDRDHDDRDDRRSEALSAGRAPAHR